MQSLFLARPFPALALLLLHPLASSPLALERLHVGGTFAMTYTQMNPVSVGDVEGHVLISNHATGTNRSTGRDPYMDRAEVANTETADLTQGNGPHQGYVIFSSGGDRTVNKWHGKITTVLGADKQPVTTFQGTWTKLNGTGRYAGVKGQGTYRGRMTGQNTYLVEWKGEIEVNERAASQ
jgi:hypothetical protein